MAAAKRRHGLSVISAALAVIAQVRPGAAVRVVAVMGGSPVIATETELLILDVGIGVHVEYKYGGRSLEVRLGNASPESIRGWASSLGYAENIRQPYSEFVDVLRACLGKKGIKSGARGNTVVISDLGGMEIAMTATEVLFGKRARAAVSEYFADTMFEDEE